MYTRYKFKALFLHCSICLLQCNMMPHRVRAAALRLVARCRSEIIRAGVIRSGDAGRSRQLYGPEESRVHEMGTRCRLRGACNQQLEWAMTTSRHFARTATFSTTFCMAMAATFAFGMM